MRPRLHPGSCEGDPPLVDFPGSHWVPRARVRAPGVELEAETRMSQEVEADPRTTRGGTRSGASSITVLLLWLGMWAADLAYVARFGSNVPYRDDWDMVPTVTGVQPVTAGWLWSQHNEHRIPVPRLVMLALYRTFGFDFRVGMVFNVCATAALALGLIQAARRLRGRASLADAFFPLVLLNWGQGINFIWGWQVEFFLSTSLAGAVLLVLASSGDRPSLAALGTIWVLLVLMVGCGAHGVALVPAIAAWQGYCGLARLRSGGPRARRDGLLILAMASSALALVLLYFVGYSPVPYHPSTRNPLRIVNTGIKFLTMGFGPSVRAFWPLSGLLTLGLLAAGLATLSSAARDRPPDRHRALGLLCFLGAMGSLTLGVGMGATASSRATSRSRCRRSAVCSSRPSSRCRGQAGTFGPRWPSWRPCASGAIRPRALLTARSSGRRWDRWSAKSRRETRPTFSSIATTTCSILPRTWYPTTCPCSDAPA